jgi:hypothetical protein
MNAVPLKLLRLPEWEPREIGKSCRALASTGKILFSVPSQALNTHVLQDVAKNLLVGAAVLQIISVTKKAHETRVYYVDANSNQAS